MKKLCLMLLVVLLSCGPAFSMSAIMGPKPVINDVLTADDAQWTGVKYGGVPVNFASNAIGANINYIEQVMIKTNTDGTFLFQIYLSGLAPKAFDAAIQNSKGNGPALNVGAIAFQDSGIVLSKQFYTHMMPTIRRQNWTWQIILNFKLDNANGSALLSALDPWAATRLFNRTNGPGGNYYWK